MVGFLHILHSNPLKKVLPNPAGTLVGLWDLEEGPAG